MAWTAIYNENRSSNQETCVLAVSRVCKTLGQLHISLNVVFLIYIKKMSNRIGARFPGGKQDSTHKNALTMVGEGSP